MYLVFKKGTTFSIEQETNQLGNSDFLKESKPINTSNLREDNKLDESSESNATAVGKNANATDEASPVNTENMAVSAVDQKPVKNVSAVFRNIDERKIQSDTKDIEDESGNNILQARRVVTASPIPTTTPTRTTSPNPFSNAGIASSITTGSLEDVQTSTVESVVRKRHRRRRQGK